jgi:hypothetical protein
MVTDTMGSYRFVNLLPGRYRIEAEKSGFKRFSREPVVVTVESAVRIDVAMEVGEVTQTVEVSEATPLLQSETSSLGQVVEARKVTEAPLNGRNPLALIALVPGLSHRGEADHQQATRLAQHLAWEIFKLAVAKLIRARLTLTVVRSMSTTSTCWLWYPRRMQFKSSKSRRTTWAQSGDGLPVE